MYKEYQTLKENGKVKFVVLSVELFESLLDRLEDDSDLRSIREAKKEPLYDQKEAEEYIFMNPVKRERLERGWTQSDLAKRLGAKQSTIAKWEKKGAVYRKQTRQKFAKVFGVNEDIFL
jgi:ribosome-binding protein aMBF1 (putative translation factor)